MQSFFKTAVIITFLSLLLYSLSFAYSIEWPYIQYRVIENEERGFFRGWFDVTKNDMPVEEDEIRSITVTDSGGNIMDISDKGFHPYVFYRFDCVTGACSEYGPTFRSGFYMNFEDDLATGSYWIEIETVDGQAEKYVYYFGKLELPVVNSASMTSRYDNRDLVLNWINPINQDNWQEVDELRILLIDDIGQEILYVAANKNDQSITIPSRILANAEAIYGTNFTEWGVQTRAFDPNGMDYARGYSDFITHDPSIPGLPDISGKWGGQDSDGNMFEITITQDGSDLSAATPFGEYSGFIEPNGDIFLSGPGEEVDEMEWRLSLSEDGTNLSGTWTDIIDGEAQGSGDLELDEIVEDDENDEEENGKDSSSSSGCLINILKPGK